MQIVGSSEADASCHRSACMLALPILVVPRLTTAG
jgi:hypothetical protein